VERISRNDNSLESWERYLDNGGATSGDQVPDILRDWKADRAELEKVVAEITTVYDEYTKLLRDELDEIVHMAANHGWESRRYEAGKELRAKIAQCKSKYLKEAQHGN
jgi:hypothetical protein